MKKALCTLLVLGILLTSSFTAFAATMGDVNSDGKLNSADALGILQHTVGAKPSNFNQSVADINSDGKINASDALMILQIAVGSIKPPMSKDDIVKLYNDSIEKSYEQTKCTLVISDDVNMTVNEILSDGKEDPELKALFEMILGATDEPEVEKYIFYKGKTLTGVKAQDIIDSDGIQSKEVESATAVKYGDGYKLTFRLPVGDIPLTEEGSDVPIDFEDSSAKITSVEIVAVTDGKGRISNIKYHVLGEMKALTASTEDSPALYMDISVEEIKTYKFTY